jgi:hypothetical protein
VITLTYADSAGNVIATDSIRVDLVDAAYVNGNGNTLTGVDSEPEEDLLAAAGRAPGGYGQSTNTAPFTQDFDANLSNDEFQVVLQGLDPSAVQSFTEGVVGPLVTFMRAAPVQTDPETSSAETPFELVDSGDESNQASYNAIQQLAGATVLPNLSQMVLATSMDKFTETIPYDRTTADDDFFFDGTSNTPAGQTNVWEMRLEDVGQGPQTQTRYLLGTQDFATGANCGDIASCRPGRAIRTGSDQGTWRAARYCVSSNSGLAAAGRLIPPVDACAPGGKPDVSKCTAKRNTRKTERDSIIYIANQSQVNQYVSKKMLQCFFTRMRVRGGLRGKAIVGEP